MAGYGPGLPTSASVRGGSRLRYTGHRTGAAATAAPNPNFGSLSRRSGRTAPFQRWIVPLLISLKAACPLQIIVRKRVDLGDSESSHEPRSPMVVRACIQNDGKEDEECQPKLWPPSGPLPSH